MSKLGKLRVLSVARFQAVLLAPVGLICGIIYSFGGFVYDVVTTGGVNLGTALAFLALIGMPVLSGAFGFAAGLIEAVLYNFFARWYGGIELSFEPSE